MTRRRIVFIVLGVVSLFTVVVATSVIRYVLDHPNDSLQQNVASWARNHHLGAVVDQLERWTHNDPPSTTPADELELVVPESESGTTTTTPTVDATTTTSAPTTTSPPRTTVKEPSFVPSGPTTTVAPGVLIDGEPEDIPVVVQPALAGEGEWVDVMKVRKEPVIWATSMRPLADYPSVVATAATYDPARFRTALFNGDEIPGRGNWKNYKKVDGRALPALVAAFNGGFRFEHNTGGYFTEGTLVEKLKRGYATFAITNEGFSTIGIFGRDIKMDGSWASLRQNLPPLVLRGEIVYQKYDVDWGTDYGDKMYTFRSSVCKRFDGRIMFVTVNEVNINMLARTLKNMGCDIAMELDINGNWPQFATYTGFGTRNRSGKLIDKRMGNAPRYITESAKDFFALFDLQTLPPGAVK